MMRNHGFVLVTVVLILSMMISMVLFNMKWLILYQKQQQQWHQYQERLTMLDQAAETLSKQFSALPASCRTVLQSDRKIGEQLLFHSCRFADAYHYVITDLGVYPCVKARGVQTVFSTQHWLLSIMDPRLGQRFV